MTAEKLHDALNLLPSDLIAAVDNVRCQPRTIKIHWARWVSLAACLAVFVYGGWLLSSGFFSKSSDAVMQMESAYETAAAEAEEDAYSANGKAETRAAVTDEANEAAPTEAAPESAQKEDALCDLPAATEAATAHSIETPRRTDTTACYTSDPRITVLRSKTELDEYFTHYAYQYDFAALEEGCTAFDDSWFKNHDLLLIVLHTIPVNQACEVTSVTEREGNWEVCIASCLDSQENAYTDWHILIETEKDQIPIKDSVLLIFE